MALTLASCTLTNEARAVANGTMPERPFVLLGQQYVADPTRSRDGVNPVYAYAHVPAGYTGDATEAVVAQVERFAPGFRDRIVATTVATPADLARDNPNQVGGDIIGGAMQQIVLGKASPEEAAKAADAELAKLQ